MKTTIFGIIFLTAASALAQQVAVKFYGANTNGLPQYWPAIVQPGTNTPPGFVQVDQATLDNIVSTNKPAYDAWESNKTATAQSKLDANIQRLLVLYNAIPDARTQLRSFANATNTLTTAQLTVAARQMADYQEKIMELLQRLGPVLKSLYKPEEDQ